MKITKSGVGYQVWSDSHDSLPKHPEFIAYGGKKGMVVCKLCNRSIQNTWRSIQAHTATKLHREKAKCS